PSTPHRGAGCKQESPRSVRSVLGKRRWSIATLARKFLPSRIPILYVILSVLVLISVVLMFFFSWQVQSNNSKQLVTNDRLLQNSVTRSVADDISQHQESFRLMQSNLASALKITSGGDLTGDHVQAPEIRALLEN